MRFQLSLEYSIFVGTSLGAKFFPERLKLLSSNLALSSLISE